MGTVAGDSQWLVAETYTVNHSAPDLSLSLFQGVLHSHEQPLAVKTNCWPSFLH